MHRRPSAVPSRPAGPRELRADLPGTLAVSARFVTDPAEDTLGRRLLATKYQGWREGEPLSDWAATSLLVAFDP